MKVYKSGDKQKMRLKYHFIVSLLLSIILYQPYGYQAFLVMLSGFLIDIDHYLWYIIKFKDFSLKKTVEKTKDTTIKYKFHVFHLYDIMIILLILSFFSKIFIVLSIGLLVHLIMDYYYMEKNGYKQSQRVRTIFQLISKKVRKCVLQ